MPWVYGKGKGPQRWRARPLPSKLGKTPDSGLAWRERGPILTPWTTLLSACWLPVLGLAHVCLGRVLAFLSLHGSSLPTRSKSFRQRSLLGCQRSLSACSVPGPQLGTRGDKREPDRLLGDAKLRLQLALGSPGLCWGHRAARRTWRKP